MQVQITLSIAISYYYHKIRLPQQVRVDHLIEERCYYHRRW